jgi:hypothetical protein
VCKGGHLATYMCRLSSNPGSMYRDSFTFTSGQCYVFLTPLCVFPDDGYVYQPRHYGTAFILMCKSAVPCNKFLSTRSD